MKNKDPVRSDDDRSISLDAGVKEALAEVCELRDRKRKKILCIYAAVLTVAVLLSYSFGNWDILLVVLAIGSVYAVNVYRDKMSDVKRQYTLIVIPALLKAIAPGLTFDHKKKIPVEDFRRADIFWEGDIYVGADLFYGSYKGVPLRFSEIGTFLESIYGESNNKDKSIVFYGIFMIAGFNRDFKSRHWVLPENSKAKFGPVIGDFIRKHKENERGHLISMGDPAFERRFVVYTEDDAEARHILTPELMRTMLTLSDRFNKGKTRIGFSFVDSNICIAIPIKLGRYLFEMPSRGKLDENAVRTAMADMKEILGVFDALELDSRPMSKDAPSAVPGSPDTAELSTGNHIDPK